MQMELQSVDYEGWTDDLWFYIIFYNITVMSGKLRETAGRAVTNVVRTCGPTHLLVFGFMSNKICLKHVRKMGGLKTVCNGTQFIVGKVSASREGGGGAQN